jgi:hypothetical protein
MSTTTTTRTADRTAALYLVFELGSGSRLGFTTGLGQKPRQRTVAARDTEAVLREIVRAKERLGLPAEASIPRLSSFSRGLHRGSALGRRAREGVSVGRLTSDRDRSQDF